MVTVIHESEPTARRPHRCSLCGRRIDPGEKYSRAMLKFDDVYTWKECTHCRALIRLHPEIAEYADDGYTTEWVYDWEPSTIAGARLLAQFKRQWRRRDGELYPLPGAAS